MEAFVITRKGSKLIAHGQTGKAISITAQSAPLARTIEERFAWWAARSNPFTGRAWARVEPLIDHVLMEIDASHAAQARRRFGSCFAMVYR